MLPSVRKDLEELETRLDFLLNKQAEIEAALAALRANLTQAMQGETNHLVAEIAGKFEAQNKMLATTFSELHRDLLEQSALDKTETIAAINDARAHSDKQAETLEAKFAAQLQNVGDEMKARVETLENAWRERVELGIDETSPQTVKDWCERVGTRLKKFGETQGMARAFAWQLLQELKELTELNRQFADDTLEWEKRLDELQRVLFASEPIMPWTSLTPHNSSATQRRELRILETSVAQMRAHVQENLLQTSGIRPLEIVPRVSPFDASVHESNEFLEVPTDDAQKHNRILSVEQMGFQKISPWGDVRLLRAARVRRYVLQENVAAAVEAEASAGEEEVPSVSGQL